MCSKKIGVIPFAKPMPVNSTQSQKEDDYPAENITEVPEVTVRTFTFHTFPENRDSRTKTPNTFSHTSNCHRNRSDTFRTKINSHRRK